VARWREIENRQALMGKGYAKSWVLPGASRIWPAMGNRSTHACRHERKIFLDMGWKGTEACKTAHQVGALKASTHPVMCFAENKSINSQTA
jgi:hypothetical protein